jgi:cystathionine beta-synthase
MTHPVLSLIGKTPLVKVRGLDTGPCELFLKLENQNPGGSIKDRIGLNMIEDAEKRGLLKPGFTIVEATAGNTGIGLALVALCKGYKIKLVVPDKMSVEKISLLRAMGADVLLTRSDVGKGHPDYYQDKAQQIATDTKDSLYINQFANKSNPDAHEQPTGPEIFSQMNQKVDAIVCGVGSGGTVTGLSRYFASVQPNCEIIVADPVGSIIAPYVTTGKIPDAVGSWIVEGIGEDFLPSLLDLSRVKKAYSISDRESFATAQLLLRTNGLLGGSSTGTLLAAALKYCQEQITPKRVLSFVCDSGNRYISKVFSQSYMQEEGLLPREIKGDLRDYVFCSFSEGSSVYVSPSETLASAFSRMKMFDLSQLPVLDGSKVVGVIDESDILAEIINDKSRFTASVSECMTINPILLTTKDSLDDVLALFKKGMVGILVDENIFYGVITKTDVVNALKLRS